MLHDVDGGFIGCVDDGTCWGKPMSLPESAWWIQIRTQNGLSGWTDQAERFSDQDACG